MHAHLGAPVRVGFHKVDGALERVAPTGDDRIGEFNKRHAPRKVGSGIACQSDR